MSKKQCRRKIWALVNPVQHAIEGAAIVPEQDLDKLRMLELNAIDSFAKGCATLKHWAAVCDMANLCEVMARDQIGPEALPAALNAQAHLEEAARRYERTKRLGTTGPGIQAFREVYAFHDLQRQSISRGEYERAIAKTRDRIRSKAPEVIEL